LSPFIDILIYDIVFEYYGVIDELSDMSFGVDIQELYFLNVIFEILFGYRRIHIYNIF